MKKILMFIVLAVSACVQAKTINVVDAKGKSISTKYGTLQVGGPFLDSCKKVTAKIGRAGNTIIVTGNCLNTCSRNKNEKCMFYGATYTYPSTVVQHALDYGNSVLTQLTVNQMTNKK